MTKKWIAITLLLFIATSLLGWRLYVSVKSFSAENDPSKIQPVQDIKRKIAQDKALPRTAPLVSRTPAEFATISENNLFSETRISEEKTDGAISTEPSTLTPKPILVAISIIDNQKRAYIIDPSSSAQGRKRQSQLKRIGDAYRGYTITDISATNIVLESGERKEIIPLHEGSKRPQAGKTPILSTRVVSIGGGTVSGGTSVQVVSGSPVSGRSAPATTPASPTVTAPGVQPVRALPAAAQQRPAPPSAAPPPPPEPQVPATDVDAQGRRIIRTPFGNIVRPNRE